MNTEEKRAVNERIPLTRQMCLDLNRMAKEICETDKYE